MELNRRTLLASGTAWAGFTALSGATSAQGAEKLALPEGAVILTAMVKAKAGQEETVKTALLSLVAPTREEPGCLCYNLHRSQADPTMFMFYEQWASKDALDAHGRTPHMKALGPQLKDKTEKGGGVVKYDLLQ